MSIAHELSCDVATAMLAKRENQRPDATSGDLMEIILEVHTTLRLITGEARRRRLNKLLFPQRMAATSGGGGNLAPGSR